MACLDMFKTDHQSLCSPMSPRISFSNGFVDADHVTKHERATSSAPESSDFEFSATNFAMIAADDIFFKGRLLPMKENCTTHLQKMTLRDELLHSDDWDDGIFPRPPKGPTRWKELLRLKRSHISGQKMEKSNGSLDGEGERSPTFVLEIAAHVSKAAQDPNSNESTKSAEENIQM